MKNLKKAVEEHNNLRQQIKFEEAIDKFYDKDVATFNDENKINLK